MDSSPNEACATCARYLISIPPTYDEKTEKPIHNNSNRRLDCCGRVICGDCIAENSRFAAYCPFCQISLHPTSLPQGLRDPPAYTPESASKPNKLSTPLHSDDELPSYTPNATPVPSEKQEQPTEDTLHFLNHAHETLPGLALAYSVPLSVLRKANNLHSDHLLQARRSIVIPGEYYKGGSLSPRPVEGEEEERRKGVIRRWMVGCKVSDYDVALLYMKQSDYNLEEAMTAYKEDEQWEKEHPIEANVRGKGKMKHDLGKRRFTGQRS